MTTYTRPVTGGTPTTGQVVKAVHVNEPIDQIYDTILAGGITGDQIAAGAVDTSELATAAVTRAKMDGTIPDGSTLATSAAPSVDAGVANKKYVDDQVAAADPSFTGGESHTFGGGLILKGGTKTGVSPGGTATVTFGTAFPNALLDVTVSIKSTTAFTSSVRVHSQHATDSFVIGNANGGASLSVNWIARGW